MAQVRRTHNSRGCGGDARMVGHRAVALAVCLCISLTCGCAWRVFGVKTSGESAGSAEVAEADAPVETDSSSERPGKTIDSGSGEVASAKLPIDLSRLAAGTVLTDAQIAEAGGEDAFFFVEPIDDELFARMQGVSFKDETPVSRDELRHIRVLHKDADGVTHVGEMVLNARIADTCVSIFRQLYDAGYPIEKMRLVEGYGGEDELSMEDDNSSAFNTRIIEGTSQISRHAYGLAVDINTHPVDGRGRAGRLRAVHGPQRRQPVQDRAGRPVLSALHGGGLQLGRRLEQPQGLPALRDPGVGAG